MADESKFCFDRELLDHIKFGRNDQAKSMVSLEIAIKYDSLGTLLHRAAFYDNAEMVQRLIDLGSYPNFTGVGGKTPLMLAVENENLASVKVLLASGGNVYTVDAKGQSTVQMVFDPNYWEPRIVEEIVRKMSIGETFLFKLVKKLLDAGCAVYRAMSLNNVYLLYHMLERQSKMEEPLEEEAENADETDTAVLCWTMTVYERIVEPNVPFRFYETKQVTTVIVHPSVGPDEKADFLSQLRQQDLYEFAAENDSAFQRVVNSIDEMVAHLAMQNKLKQPASIRVKCSSASWNETQITDDHLYELCQQMLDIKFFADSTLLHLLTCSKDKMREYVSIEGFESTIERACNTHTLRRFIPLYFKILMLRISRAKESPRTFPEEEECEPKQETSSS